MTTILEVNSTQANIICQIARKTWWKAYGGILSEGQIEYMLENIYNEKNILQQIESESQKYLLLFEDGNAVGFTAYAPRLENPEIFKLHKLYCLPSAQKKGYGKMLLEKVERKVLEAGKHILELNVNRHNVARGFYERMGFVVVCNEDIPIGPFWMNDYVMRKHL